MKSLLAIVIVLFVSVSCGHSKASKVENNHNPKLIVGIVVDQMRYDYLTRFYPKYGSGGFKRMVNEGFNLKNNHYNFIPTYTGPGHAAIYTGTTPKYNGIISNYWYDKNIKKSVYCTGDDNVQSVGTKTTAGQMSPYRMKTTSFADENRLFTQMKGKTIGISIKDRGAILPAGHTANAAYWFQGKDEGNWVTSTFYMNELPKWVVEFNESDVAQSYFKPWGTLLDINSYTESGTDLNNFEGGFKGKKTAEFPYDLEVLKKTNNGFDILKTTPYGNNLTTDFALAAIDGEQLGQDNATDVLAISYSSTDYIGHNFGVNSKEIEDTYLRLDKDLERFFKALDVKVGLGNYTVFLTSDHGAVNVPSYLKSVKIPAGYINNTKNKKRLEEFVKATFKSSDLIENVSNNQVFLNRKKIKELEFNLVDVQSVIAQEVLEFDNISEAYTAKTISNTEFSKGVAYLLQNGFNQKRSGDVIFMTDPAYIQYSKTGSTHGSGLNYDTHVPLLFFGCGINQGATLNRTEITDIAPTISALLGIGMPNNATGNPLVEVLKGF